MSYLHTTLNWAVTLMVGGIVVITTRPSFPDHLSLIALLIILVMLAHFAVRTCKAYLNIIRWTTLEKHILNASLADDPDEEYREIADLIDEYHFSWKSPLGYWDLAYKLLFELGFFYFFAVTLTLLGYTIVAMGFSSLVLVEVIVSFGLVVLEIWMGLVKSSYLREVVVDPIARKHR